MNGRTIYIASCNFTKAYPALSYAIQQYVKSRWQMELMRCCTPKYRTRSTEEALPAHYRPQWQAIDPYLQLQAGDTICSVCNNCLSIVQETHPEVNFKSLWEMISDDDQFLFPNLGGKEMTVQDCWRSYDNPNLQNAVRAILSKMNVSIVELDENREKTNFCGTSLYQSGSARTLKLAPIRYVQHGEGKFIPHTDEQRKSLMLTHAQKFCTDEVLCYCHTCQKGLELGEKKAIHLAQLLFGE